MADKNVLETDELSHKRLLRHTPDQPWNFRRVKMVNFTTFVVQGTHPDQPNYSGNSRGRKRHLSRTLIQGEMTLCNMRVGEPFMEHIDVRIHDGWSDPYVNNGWCGNCTIAYNKSVRKSERIKRGGQIN